MMSLCDRCYRPGSCCKGFQLFLDNGEERTYWLDVEPEEIESINLQLRAARLPFRAMEILERFKAEDGAPYGTASINCPELQPGGRCGIYDKRPEICRSFEAASGPLCIHYGGAEGVDLTVEAA